MKLNIYKTQKSAIAAIKRHGLHLMNYEIKYYCSAEGTGFIVKFYVHDLDDYCEMVKRGFKAKIDPEKAA